VHVLKNPLSLQGRKVAAIFSLKVMEVLRYKGSLYQWMYKENVFYCIILYSVWFRYRSCDGGFVGL
jgi:hypothetical protein